MLSQIFKKLQIWKFWFDSREKHTPGKSTSREYASPGKSTSREKHTPGKLTPHYFRNFREEHTPGKSTIREYAFPGKSTSREKHSPGKSDSREEHTPGKSLQNRFSARIRIFLQNAISTAYQGPRSKIMSEKNRGQKSRVSVPLRKGCGLSISLEGLMRDSKDKSIWLPPVVISLICINS